MILITGATGMVGAQLLFDLTAGGQKVRAMRRSSSSMDVVNRIFSPDPSRLKNVEWVEGDVNDLFSIEDAMQGVDTVYHSAGKISFRAADIPLLNRVNVDGTANMVNMALEKNIKRFCHVSSVAAIGRSAGNTVVTEKSSWKTSKENSNYAISKYAGEREVWRAIEEGLPAFIVNPTIIIGPGDWHSGSTQMFSSVAKGLKFYATGSTGFVDVRDVSNAAIQLNAKGVVAQRYILNGENLPYRTVFNTIARELKKPEATIKVSPFIGELGWRVEGLKSFLLRKKSLITRETVRNGGMDWEYSNAKVCKEIGFSFMPIAQSIKDTSEYFLVS